MTDIRKQEKTMREAAVATATPEGFTDLEWEKFERFQIAKEAKRIKAEREKAGLTTRATLRRNETGSPLSLPRGCSLKDDLLAKDLRCAGSDPVCRLAGQKPVAAPGEFFWTPAGHYDRPDPALSEADPGSVGDESTLQDRLVLGEFRSVEQRAEGPATLAARTLADLEAQKRILEDRILQQHEEVDRRRSHVEAAKAKTEEFLNAHSEAWRKALLGGAAEASLESIRQAGEANADRGHVGTMDQLRRSQGGDVGGPAAFAMSGANGQPVKLPVDRS